MHEQRGTLYSVEFAIHVEGRGLTVLCRFPDPKLATVRVGDAVEFVRPDERVIRSRVRSISMVMDARPGLIGIQPEGVVKDDIPLGTMLRLLPL